MEIYSDTNPKKMTTLLHELAKGVTALPDFQRSFVWDADSTAGLLVSLARSFPAGSLLRIENRGEFAQRAIEGAPPLSPHDRPTYLLLDGQQRLTSLYQAFYGAGDHEYFLDLNKLTDNEHSFEEALIWEKRDGRAALKLRKVQFEQLILPLAELRNAPRENFDQWISRARHNNKEEHPQRLTADFDLWQHRTAIRWINPFAEYKFPVATLVDDVSVEAVCMIFETLNLTGVKLTPFELLTARFFVQGVNLRSLWNQAREKYPILHEFGFDSYQMLQAMVVVRKGRDMSRGGVLQLKPEEITEYWWPIVEGSAAALHLVQDHYSIASTDWLAGTPVIVGMAAASARLARLRLPPEQFQRLLLRWYWNILFGNIFGKGTSTALPREVDSFCRWIEGGAIPESMSRFRFDKMTLGELGKRSGNLHKAFVGVLLANRPRNLDDGRLFTMQQLANEKPKTVVIHELLPAEAFTKLSYRADSVVNQMLLSSSTARKLRSSSLADYLHERRRALGDAEFQAVMDSHLISREALQALLDGDARRFCSARSETIYERIMYLVN